MTDRIDRTGEETNLQVLISRANQSQMDLHGVVPLSEEQTAQIHRLTGITARSLTFGSLQIGNVSIAAMPVMSW
jgi:hypothetical protein